MKIRRHKSGFHFVELLVVLIVVCLLAAFLIPHYLGQKTQQISSGQNIQKEAQDTVCRTNLLQARQNIAMRKTAGQTLPGSLSEYNLSLQETHCPAGGEAYIYSPGTGEIHCPHPSHELY